MSQTPPDRTAYYLTRNEGLVRRAAIRHILAGRYHSEGIQNITQIRQILEAKFGIKASKDTVSVDLRKLRAFKAVDQDRPSIQWWMIPAYSPQIEDLRNEIPTDVLEAEIELRLDAHVIDIMPLNSMVHVLCEPRAGYLVAYWVSWLNWPGIVRVQEGLDSFTIYCLNDYTAVAIARRLIGSNDIPWPERDKDAAGTDAATATTPG